MASTCTAWCSTNLELSRPAAVTLDLWQTLIFEVDGSSVSHARREARTQATVRELNRLGVDMDQDTVRDGFKDLSQRITAGHDDGHDAQYEARIADLVEQLAPGLTGRIKSSDLTKISQLVDETFLDSPPNLLPGAREVLRELKDRGLKVGLISNTGLTSPQTYEQWFGDLDILDSFDFLAFSNAQEVAKPARGIFDVTLETLGVDAERTLHVGDNLHTDVGGAGSIGMSTVWVRGGINSPVEPSRDPDYSVDSILELPGIVDQWLPAIDATGRD